MVKIETPNDCIKAYIQAYAEAHGLGQLSSSELKECLAEARWVLDGQLGTTIHNAKADFVC